MFTNNKPTEGSIDTPPQFPPPSVLGKNNALPSSGSGVYGSPELIPFAFNHPPPNCACSRGPIPPAERARKEQRVAFERQRRIRLADLHPIRLKQLPAKPRMLRRPVIHVLQAERVLRQRWRLDGKRLRLRSHFAWHRRLGHRPFFHPVHRLPREAVEHEQQSHLRDLRDRRNDPPAAANVK